jgi:hypothetical protein
MSRVPPRVGDGTPASPSLGRLVAGAVFWLACSPAAPVDLGTDYSPRDLDSITQEDPGATLDGTGDVLPFDGLVDEGSPFCPSAFEPCGGLLAGTWEMVDTCSKQTFNRKALQIWGQTVMNLDTGACWNAVSGVSTEWKGDITFAQGIANDQRMRVDTVEMQLTRDCLNATYDVAIKAEKMGSVCTTLSAGMMTCSSVGGVCHCSKRRESETNTAGVYGVLEKAVVIGGDTDPATDEPKQYFDYCVQNDQLMWRARDTGRLVVLRRVLESDEKTDPPFLR